MISGGTFALEFYGNGPIECEAKVTNKISGTPTFKGIFHGTYSENNTGFTIGNVTTEVSGSPVFEKTFYSMGYDKDTAGSKGKTVTTKISGGTFKASAYMSGRILRDRVATTTISGGTFDGILYLGAYNSSAKEINTTIKGGTFNDYVYGGNNNATKNVNAKKINTLIEGGKFNGTFYGGCKGYKAGDIHTTVKGGTFGSFIGGNNGDAETAVVNTITNELLGGTFENVYAGTRYGTVETVTNIVDGAKITSSYHGSYGGTAGAVHNTIQSANIGGSLYLGAWNGTSSSVDSLIHNVTVTGSFYGGNKKGTCGDVTLTVENATVTGSFYGGNTEGTCGDINLTVKNADVTGSMYSGSAAGTCGAITTVIDYVKVKSSLGLASYGGTVTGEVKGTIKDCNVSTYTYISGNCGLKTPEGFTEDYLVDCEILGGTFKGVWAGGANASSTYYLQCNVRLTVRGGTFNLYKASDSTRQNALCAGGRNKKTVGDIDVFIYGGTFNGEVIAGACPNSSGTSYIHDDEGTQSVTIYGGTFNKPILAGSKWGTVTKGKVVLNPAESDIILNSTMLKRTDYNKAQEFEIVGAEHKIILGADAEIEATAISGDVKFGQGATWAKRTYADFPEGNAASITVTGPHCFDRVGNSIVAVKGGIQLSAATMILTDRVAIRALFDQASVDQIDDFTFTFKMGDATLAEGTKENLEAYGDAYYGIVLAKVGAKDFTKGVTFTGSDLVWENEFSIKTLAETAETAWGDNEKGVALAKAMQNFATIVADPTATLPHDLTPEAVDYTASGELGTETAFKVSGKGLVMGNAVGIRIYGTADSDVTSDYFTVKVNGNDVTDLAVIGAGENAGEYTIDLYVQAKDMSTALQIEIIEKATGKVCLTLTDRVDAIAASYPEDNKLVQQLLVYIQAAVDYAKA